MKLVCIDMTKMNIKEVENSSSVINISFIMLKIEQETISKIVTE